MYPDGNIETLYVGKFLHALSFVCHQALYIVGIHHGIGPPSASDELDLSPIQSRYLHAAVSLRVQSLAVSCY